MKGNGKENQTLVICFGQFGPYHHARVAALQRLVWEMGDGSSAENRKLNTGDCSHAWRVLPVQIAAATSTYAWSGPSSSESLRVGEDQTAKAAASPPLADGLRTLCEGTDEAASPLDVFLKARKLFRAEGVGVAFLPSYSPARFFALFAAAKSLGIRTVMMNESHAGTEQATGWKRWIKRQIVKQFDAALVGGEPHKRHFASLGIPADKIFTGYDSVDNDFFASRADEIRMAANKSVQFLVGSVQQEETADQARSLQHGAGSVEQDESSKDQETKRQSVREAYGLPERYFLSLGRMVEKKNLSTLVEAYARFARASVEKHGAGSGEHGVRETADGEDPHAGGQAAAATKAENCKLKTEHCPPGLVFVGSGELEGALREQVRGLGLKVLDRTDAGAKTKGLKDDELSLQTAGGAGDGLSANGAIRSQGQTKVPQGQAEPRLCETGLSQNCKPNTENSVESDCGAVYFYGFRQIEENPVFYALADAFILPSLKEEWGLVVNEAMACSLPVIVSRTAGCAEDLLPGSESVQCSVGSVQSGEEKKTEDRKLSTGDSLEQRSNGFVFDPSSVEALATALACVAETGDARLEMGKRSREIVAKFSCENFAQQALRAVEAARPGAI